MGLRRKTLVTIGTTLIIMILIIYFITSLILLGGYTHLERQNIIQNSDQAMNMIAEELAQLKSVVGDWAPWDDTYLFVQDKNQEYIDDNLMESTVINLHVNFLIYINNAGKIVYCKYTDLETGKGGECPDSILRFLSSNPFLLRDKQHRETLTGVALLPEDPILLAFAPILTSQFKGPVMGTLVAGRYLNRSEVKKITAKANLSIDIQRMDSPQLSDDFENAKHALTPDEKVAVVELSKNTIAAYTMLTDFNKQAILMLRVDKVRNIYAQGEKSMRYLVVSMLIIGIVFIIATVILLERTVLSRILRLNNEIKHIGITGDMLARTWISGKDELADLSTEINHMLESLQISTERDRAILDSIEDAYFELDLEGNLIFYNHSLSRLIKNRIKDFKKINYRQFLDNESADEIIEVFQQLYKTGESIKELETELNFENEDKVFLESSISLIEGPDGKGIGFRGIARDITERKKEKEILLKSEERLSLALEVSLAGAWEVDLKTKKFTFDSNLYSSLGYSSDDPPKEISDILKIIDPGDVERVKKCFLKFAEGKCSTYRDDFLVITKSGEKRWMHNRAKAIQHFDDKKPMTVIGTMIDITDLKRAEQNLKDNEERYRTILENRNIGYFETDLSGNLNFVNDALCALMEYESDEMLDLNYKAYTDTQTSQKIEHHYREIFETGKPLTSFEYSIVTKNGRSCQLETSVSLRKSSDGKPIGFRGLTIDITDRKSTERAKKKLEKELRQTHKMEAIGTLAGGIAHDFNNILSGIFGYAQLAKNNVVKPLKLEGHIDQIIKGASRAAGLIQQILAFSRQTEQEKILINIAVVVKEAVRLLRSSIPSTIDIQEKIFSKSKVAADPTQIHQVIMNLCTNAYHAMRDKGGVLTIELYDICLPDQNNYPDVSLPSGKYVAIVVKDTGCGMDEDTLQKVFDPYFTTKQVGDGTGLGLSIVYGIVEDHGGLVKADSSINMGSVFQVFFPNKEDDNPLLETTEDLSISTRGKERLMVVDDEKSILLSTQENLEDNGYKIKAFINPGDALKEFKKHPDQFDLIITDMTMPGITGDLLSKDVLEVRPDMPIILCTGYSEKISESKAFEMGIKKFVQKPIDTKRLLYMIREVLDEKKPDTNN